MQLLAVGAVYISSTWAGVRIATGDCRCRGSGTYCWRYYPARGIPHTRTTRWRPCSRTAWPPLPAMWPSWPMCDQSRAIRTHSPPFKSHPEFIACVAGNIVFPCPWLWAWPKDSAATAPRRDRVRIRRARKSQPTLSSIWDPMTMPRMGNIRPYICHRWLRG